MGVGGGGGTAPDYYISMKCHLCLRIIEFPLSDVFFLFCCFFFFL